MMSAADATNLSKFQKLEAY